MKISIVPSAQLSIRSRLWQSLSELFSLEFVAEKKDVGAVIAFSSSRIEAEEIAATVPRCLAFVTASSLSAISIGGNIDLSEAPELSRCFRGRSIRHAPINGVLPLRVETGDRVLASCGESVLWLRESERTLLDLAALEPPRTGAGEYLFQHFESENWLHLLPLLHFLRELSEWTPPPVRACFMFDDPNLHWRSYGYIDYSRMVEHARACNYHVSFATIPLDQWYVHRPTVSLFRENTDRLSLCTHGNNHTYFELMESEESDECDSLAAQALGRTTQFEKVSGLKVARVMTAPHGACSELMASALIRAGFEAACISRSSLMGRNPGAIWPIHVGLAPSEFAGVGLPVIPRFNMKWDQTYVLFAAFLGRAIVPVGHHQDCDEECELLERLAALINSLGDVRWMDMQSIARTNFMSRRRGELLQVRMFARAVALVVPSGVNRIVVERPWLQGKNAEPLRVSSHLSGHPVHVRLTELEFAVAEGEEVEITSVYPKVVDYSMIKPRPTPLWAYTRRYLCEARDRLRPLKDRLKLRRNGKR